MQKLHLEKIKQKLSTIKGWQLEGKSIAKEWQFNNFKDAMRFINQVADLAEKHNHHPEIINVYNRVSLRFSTHDVGGLTNRDFIIAADIDNLT